jgi:hypothetical protein
MEPERENPNEEQRLTWDEEQLLRRENPNDDVTFTKFDMGNAPPYFEMLR